METLSIIGYLCLMLTGVALGLLGAGGAIVGVPILVYLLGVPPVRATGYSLVVVGVTAVIGAFQFVRRGFAHPRMALLFGVPAAGGAYLARRVVFPAIPDPVFQLGGGVSKNTVVMVIFAVFMAVAATRMIQSGGRVDTDEYRPHHYIPAWVIALLGVGVGALAGFVGAGGGFLILPVLVLRGGLPMRMAIGTSLLIIAGQSLVGFVGETQAVAAVDYAFIASIVAPPVAGIFLGTWLNTRVPATKLKIAFGWFLLIVCAVIVAREVVMV